MRLPCVATLLAAVIAFASGASAQQTEKRIALVVGNGAYQAEALPTAANDAGLIAQTLQAAGFDVVGARDLDQDTLRRTFRDFIDKATASGPNTVAVVYLSGYGLQLEGENYFAPIDAKIARDTDVPTEALRVSDYTRPLAALKLKATVVVLDAARANPFAKTGQPLASGLALMEPDQGVLIGFNAAPGTVGPREKGPYGAYAQALAEMIRTGGLQLPELFDRVRLRVNENTKGGEVPWNASKVDASFVFLDRASNAPAPLAGDQAAAVRDRPIQDLDAKDAYIAALEKDTLQGYLDFLGAYPNDPMAKRVRAIVAARREAITWRRSRSLDTPPAYWSYLRRYPHGPHAADAHRRLAYLAAAEEPPPSFTVVEYDVPPPPPDEVVYFRRPVLYFDDPEYDFAPPPPPPVFFLPPPPPDFIVLEPPPPPIGLFILPIPAFVPLPVYYNPPVYVAPPPPNIIYNNIHNTVVVNTTTNIVTVTTPSGQTQTLTAAQALAPRAGATAPAATAAPTAALAPAVATGVVGAAAGAALLAPRLPAAAVRKAAVIQTQNPQAKPAALGPNGAPVTAAPSGQKPQQGAAVAPNALPGANGQPLPTVNGKAVAPALRQSVRTPPTATQQKTQPALVAPNAKATAQPAVSPNGRAPSQANSKPAASLTKPQQPTPPARRVVPSPSTRAAPQHATLPPAATQHAKPPVVARPAPPRPPAVAHTAPSQPVRSAPPPRPPVAQVAHPAPPRPAPPPAARRAPAAAKEGCKLPDGKPCPPR